MTRRPVTAAWVEHLSRELTERDLAIVATLDRVRVATAGQLRRLHFTGQSPRANARQAQRRLRILVELGVLAELDRKVGGAGGGSAQSVYALDVAGQRLGAACGPAGGRRLRRPWTPGLPHLAHTLDVTEVFVQLREWERAGRGNLLAFDGEPSCWRVFSGLGGARTVLKPDAFAHCADAEYEHFAFIEVDRATASLPAIQRKLGIYARYVRVERESARFGAFPRIVFLAPTEARRVALTETIRGSDAMRDIAVAHLFDDAVGAMTGIAGRTASANG